VILCILGCGIAGSKISTWMCTQEKYRHIWHAWPAKSVVKEVSFVTRVRQAHLQLRERVRRTQARPRNPEDTKTMERRTS
jgi:hypothetical protein